MVNNINLKIKKTTNIVNKLFIIAVLLVCTGSFCYLVTLTGR